MAARYFSPDDPETYVTPSQLKRLGRKKQVAYMVHWFATHFEDPQNEMPYADKDDSGDSSYRYPWGGPYDADTALQEEFDAVVPFERIQDAVQEVQADGILEWAPRSAHPDRRAHEDEAMAEAYEPPLPSLDDIRGRLANGVRPNFGDPFEAQEREFLRSEIAQLREMLAQAVPGHGGMGHNNPPEDMALSVELAANVTTALTEMDAELAKPAPNVAAVVESVGKLEQALAWIAKKLDKSADGFMTALGSAGGVALVAELAGLPVSEKLAQVFNATLEWLNTVTLPF